MLRPSSVALAVLIVFLHLKPQLLMALNPRRALTQYTKSVWTQGQGLPQDTVHAIAQTRDGYLWIGTDEGLVRFDGYEFVNFTKNDGAVPDNSITALKAVRSGDLWIGTSSGVVRYSRGRFQIFTGKDGLPVGTVYSFLEDHHGDLWAVLGGNLSRFENGKFKTFPRNELRPLGSVGAVYEDEQGQLWIGGHDGILKRNGNKSSVVLRAPALKGSIISAILRDSRGLWAAGTRGILRILPDGTVKRYTTRDGLPNDLVRALYEDRAGNLWVGTNGGLSRFDNERFVSLPRSDANWVWCIFEDRESDLWIGMNSGLVRLRDDSFNTYGRSEGYPDDEPIVVRQDQRDHIWIGYHDAGLLELDGSKRRLYTTYDGLPSNEIFGIRVTNGGELLIGTRRGLSRLRSGHILNYSVPNPAGSSTVIDAIEDERGHLWIATASGVYELNAGKWRPLIGGDAGVAIYTVALTRTRDGSFWAGTLNSGLWQLVNRGDPSSKPRLFTTADGLGSNQIRSLYEDSDGTLWIGTFGGGLSTLHDGMFHHYGVREGLLSDNISHVEDDGNDLWLSTDRGICRVHKSQFNAIRSGKLVVMTPRNYGISDGLRSAQCASAFPAGGGGTRTTDGNLWFPTSQGLATISPQDSLGEPRTALDPLTHLEEISVNGHTVSFARAARIDPGAGRVQFRYSGVYLRAPELVHYAYRLEGLDREWVSAGTRRVVDYNPLPHGKYRFIVRASLPGNAAGESQFAFEVLPHFYEARWFWGLCCLSLAGLIFGLHQLRLRQVGRRFALVFEERARLARDIHDTLAQGFVGISFQLDTLEGALDGDPLAARQYLQHAQKMVRHSLTEARRSMTHLRTAELPEEDFSTALMTAADRWVAGTRVDLQANVDRIDRKLSPELAQNLLCIAQEAVTNAVKHATARVVRLDLKIEGDRLKLRVEDDGRGFELANTFSVSGGHFGIVGMRERAQRLGGDFHLRSRPGSGTLVQICISL